MKPLMRVEQLRVNLGKLELANPVMLASGVQGSSLSKVLEALEYGAGAAVTKSIGLVPKEGYPEPTIVQSDAGMVNAVGLPNPGAKNFSNELAVLRGRSLPVLVSVYGSGPEEFAEVVKTIDSNDIAGYELNLSCPHVEGVGTEVGHEPELVRLVVKAAKSRTRKPVFAKLSPNTERLVEVAAAAGDAGADGITAINAVRAMVIDTEKGKPSLSNRYGGLSGGAIRPIALRCVYELSEELDLPIIGCGGISTWEHAVQFLLAGASAVQVGTATINRFALFNDINLGILSYMESKGHRSVGSIVSAAHRGEARVGAPAAGTPA
jgi:dihydroorotate dehydrogenase (NAD+) catalytic subunit